MLRIGFLHPKVQFGKKIWFQKIGEEGINSTLKRRIQGTFVGRNVVEKRRELERKRFHILSADIEVYGHMGSSPGYELLASQGSESEPERLSWREKPGGNHTRTESRKI